VLIIYILLAVSTDEDPGLRIESFAGINLCGGSTNNSIMCIICSYIHAIVYVSIRNIDALNIFVSDTDI
jgi:hypothetical protein